MEALFLDETQPVEQRINAAHWGISLNRLRPEVTESCGRILSGQTIAPAVQLAIVASLFDNRPAEGFGKRSPYPAPRPWTQATRTMRAAYVTVASAARRLPGLPDPVVKAINDAMRRLGK